MIFIYLNFNPYLLIYLFFIICLLINEFFDVQELKDNPIVKRIIHVFDKNGNRKIRFLCIFIGLSTLKSDVKLEEKQKITISWII